MLRITQDTRWHCVEVTGMEAALDLVRQSWVNRPLTELEVQRHLASKGVDDSAVGGGEVGMIV